MEVHAHTHTARKKWTNYFWEFLMLFLAVFCGFLAEYQLEHKIEREREKEYMKGMVDDLTADTTNLNNTTAFVYRVLNGLDSLQRNLYNANSTSENTIAIYRQSGRYLRRFAVNFTDQTATQLRNAGTLRLIKKKNVVDAISKYWRGTIQVERIEDRLDESMDEISTICDDILNRSNYLGFSKRDSLTRLSEVSVKPDATLMPVEKRVLINFANKTNRLQSRIENFYVTLLISQKKDAINLIQLIKKEYRFN